MRNGISVLAAALSGLAAVAFPQVPAGGEFQVNTFTLDRQASASAAALPLGQVLVTWESALADGSGFGVFGQRYSPAGARIGAEFRVNSFTSGDQSRPAVAADGGRRFVVVWQSAGQDGSAGGIFGRRFEASGIPIGSEFAVNSTTSGNQSDPSVSADRAGNFVVTWTSTDQDGSGTGVFAQRFAAAGQRLGGEFQANTFTTGDQYLSAVAADAAGNFVVVWGSAYPHAGVFGQRFAASGAPRGAEFHVADPSSYGFLLPAVAADPAGNFVVSWSRCEGGPLTMPYWTVIMARQFSASGVPLSSGIHVASPASCPGPGAGSAVACDSGGHFIVTWGEGYGGTRVAARRFDALGAPRGAAFTVTTSAYRPAVAADRVGNFLVAWDTVGEDGSAAGVFARRFGGIVPDKLIVDTDPSASDGNGVLEPAETVDVRPAWRNVNGSAQTFAGNATLLGAPAPGVAYQLVDGAGAYGTVADGAAAACTDCYEAAVAFGGVRPALHWDVTFRERLTPDFQGQTKAWALHVGDSFGDVPRTSPFYRPVETLLHAGVTAGCGGGLYCPQSATTRAQMAAFVVLAREGPGYVPPACAAPTRFADVPAGDPFCDVIEELARRGVVAGCDPANYCPGATVSREQMAVFVLRTLDPAFTPPACATPMFGDVPASSPFCRWIEELARRGVVAGCGGGNYCPAAPVTREQMAVFLGGTFGLQLYGP